MKHSTQSVLVEDSATFGLSRELPGRLAQAAESCHQWKKRSTRGTPSLAHVVARYGSFVCRLRVNVKDREASAAVGTH